MEMLATALSLRADRPVIDKTGLPGTYDLSLQWAADPSADGSPREAGSIKASTDTAAMLHSLANVGLRAEPRKIPLKYLVVEQATKIPIEN